MREEAMKGKKLDVGGWMRRRLRGESGQALVETAIAAPVLFLLLMGAAELARVAYMAIEVANAARAGAEYASQNAETMSDTEHNQTNTSSSNGTARAATADAYNVSLLTTVTTTTTTGYVCSDGSTASVSTTTDPTCPNGDTGATAIPYVTVTSKATFNPLIHIPGLPTAFALSSSATESCLDCL
jgi:Flp pilus assembly protein TadG